MIDVLTSFRFIAAFFVFLHHTGSPGTGYGERGVTYFFILSGFILAYKYYDKFHLKLEMKTALSFYSSRISRIYPVHLITFFLALLLSFFIPSYFILQKPLANLALMQWLHPGSIFTFNPASWSLSVELVFYILFPFMMFTFGRLVFKGRPVSQVPLKALFGVLAGIYLIQCVTAFTVGDADYSASLIKWWLMYVSPFRATDFSIGVILALIYMKCRDYKALSVNFKLLSKQAAIFTFIEICALLPIFISFFKPIFSFNAAGYAVNYVPGLAALILVFSFQKGLLSWFLCKKPFVFLGEISFSFFMLHYFVIAFFNGFLDRWGRLTTLQILLTSIILSAVIHKFYELPARDKMRAFLTIYINKFTFALGNKKLKSVVKQGYDI